MKRQPTPGPRRPAPAYPAFALACCLLGVAPLTHAGECVREDQAVRVMGKVSRQVMTRLTDERNGARTHRDNVVSMTLREPLCVMLPDDVSLAMRPKRIKEVQLLHAERLPSGRDQGVLIDGKVLLATTSAHHHPVLIEVAGLPATRASAPVVAPAPTSRHTTLAVARIPR
ncbi:MAG: hypothetical protein RI907_2554 [Pseudomonadota bacterium]|jgi:hypothetical protein